MHTKIKTDWSYLAGLLDGEGCFSIAGSWKTRKRANGLEYQKAFFHMNLLISLYNTDLKIMKWLIEKFGGVYYVHHPSKNPNHKVGYSWHPKGAKNKELLLLGVLPYLVIKTEQAQIALDYIRLNGERHVEQRLALRERIQTLNGHGNGKRPTTNMSDDPFLGSKIESELTGDRESELMVMSVASV
jgi:hypothetical protein